MELKTVCNNQSEKSINTYKRKGTKVIRRTERENGRLMSVEQLQAYCCIGRNNAIRFGKESGAAVRIGKRLLFDREKIDQYIEEQRQQSAM